MAKKTTLRVDQQDIPLNPFVEKLFTNLVQGLVNSLDRIPSDPKKIEIVLQETGGAEVSQ